jgi:hypothetical protein
MPEGAPLILHPTQGLESGLCPALRSLLAQTPFVPIQIRSRCLIDSLLFNEHCSAKLHSRIGPTREGGFAPLYLTQTFLRRLHR